MHPIAYGQVVPFPKRITYHRPGSLRRSSSPDTGHPPCGGGNADRIRPVGVVLLKHGIKHRGMFARAPWSMPMNRVIQQEAYPL